MMFSKKVFIMMMFVALAVGIYISSSYAYFGLGVDINSSSMKEIKIDNSLYIVDYYDDGVFKLKANTFMPSDTITKSILVINSNTVNKTIKIKFIDVTNTFSVTSNLTYTVSCSPYANYYDNTTTINTDCSEVSNNGNAPTASNTDIYSVIVKPQQSVYITVTLEVDALWPTNATDGFLGYIVAY